MIHLQKKRVNNESGFTLIEVIIALFFFSVCMLGIGALQLNSMKSVSKAEILTTATSVANSEMELLKSLPMDDVKDSENSKIIQKGIFWTQRIVTNDYPVGKRLVDCGVGYVDTTVCKTIEVKVFQDSAGKRLLASTRFIKSRSAVE